MTIPPMTQPIQRRKFNFPGLAKAVAGGVLATFTFASLASAQATGNEQTAENISESIAFLQNIQGQLHQGYNMKGRIIRIHITVEQKRRINITPSSISFSYGFLKNMENINQLVAAMAHMTAHINLDYVSRPGMADNPAVRLKDASLETFIKRAISQKYPDEGYMPQATGSFHDNNNRMEIIERPSYQNKNYAFAVNKTKIIKAEHELETDKITDKIMRHSGFCPSDYSRMLHYFYETPQKLLGNKHFPLDADQWQRIDVVDRRADPYTACNKAQIALTQKYAEDFYQLKVRPFQTRKVNKNLQLSRSFPPEEPLDLR